MKPPEITIAAIDNGLAFPYKHPDEWRACECHLLVLRGEPVVHKTQVLKPHKCLECIATNLMIENVLILSERGKSSIESDQ